MYLHLIYLGIIKITTINNRKRIHLSSFLLTLASTKPKSETPSKTPSIILLSCSYTWNDFVDNAEFAAGVKQSAKISFDDDVAPARRTKLSAVDKNNAINLDERITDVPDSNIKIEGEFLTTWHVTLIENVF